MRRVALIFNPAAGRHRNRRVRILHRVATALESEGCQVETIATTGPGSAGEQARELCGRGFDIVFACGGDGTVHEVLQGMVFQQNASLGIIPLGSANALARHLGLSRDPVRAAEQQVVRESRLLPVGHIAFMTPSGQRARYFAVMAGAGADGALVYRMLAASKQRFGRVSYYARAVMLALFSRFAPFSVSVEAGGGQTMSAVSAIVVRIADLGGAFSPLVRGGSLENTYCKAAVAVGSARLSLSAWFALGWLRLAKLNRHVRFFDATELVAGAGAHGEKVQVQADGEWLGTTPMTIKVVEHAVRLLVPKSGV